MILSQDRKQLRSIFINSWKKTISKITLSPLETQISRIIELHPEYQNMMNDDYLDKDFDVDSGMVNPFLHMSLHLSVVEQYQTNRPVGFRDLYDKLVTIEKNEHIAHHIIMDYIAEEMWISQRNNTIPNETNFLNKIKDKINAKKR